LWSEAGGAASAERHCVYLLLSRIDVRERHDWHLGFDVIAFLNEANEDQEAWISDLDHSKVGILDCCLRVLSIACR